MPHGTLGAASAGMLSVDGRCKTLDARANGYVRSEGVGALVLLCEGSGVTLYGSAVRQDGRSASLTAPNGSAQRTLLFAALEHASLHAVEVGSLEAHGTGTALGDPTEAGALVSVHGMAVKRITSTVVGAAKASVGHTEAASGQVGLLRRSEAAGMVSGNAQLRLLNPLVAERLGVSTGCFTMPVQAMSSRLAKGGVSSFGYSGTIAHAVLEFGHGGVLEALAFGRAADSSEVLGFGPRGADEAGGPVLARCSDCLLYTSPSPRDRQKSRMPSSA